MDPRATKERTESEERKMTKLNFGQVDKGKLFSYSDKVKQACVKNVELALDDMADFRSLAKKFEKMAQDYDNLNAVSTDEHMKRLYYLQAEVFRLRSIMGNLMTAAISANERLWRMNVFILEGLEHDILHTSGQTKKEFVEELQKLQSKYDVSHNGILNYLEKVRKVNPWFQEERRKEE